MNAFAEICLIRSKLSPVSGSTCHIRLQVYQGADEVAKFFVEIG